MAKPHFHALVWQPSTYSLYEVDKGKITHLTTHSTSHPEKLLQDLTHHKVKILKLFDHTPAQVIRREKCPKVLRYSEYLQWYWQKKAQILQSFGWGYIKADLRRQEIMAAGLNTLPFDEEFLKMPPFKAISLQVYSYSLELGCCLRALLKKHLLQQVLIVTVNRALGMTLWFFEDQHLSFWRLWKTAASEAMLPHLPLTVKDTLKYLEKIIRNSQEISLAFFIESPEAESVLRDGFPKALIFGVEEFLSSGIQTPHLLDQLVLAQPAYRAPLRQQGNPFAAEFLPLICRGITACILLTASYLFYQCWGLAQESYRASHHTRSIRPRLDHLKNQLTKASLSPTQALILQPLLNRAASQQTHFWQFLHLLPKALGHQYTLQALAIDPRKVRLSITRAHGLDPYDTQEFLDNWGQILPHYQPTLSAPSERAGSTSSIFILECPSPFYEAP